MHDIEPILLSVTKISKVQHIKIHPLLEWSLQNRKESETWCNIIYVSLLRIQKSKDVEKPMLANTVLYVPSTFYYSFPHNMTSMHEKAGSFASLQASAQ